MAALLLRWLSARDHKAYWASLLGLLLVVIPLAALMYLTSPAPQMIFGHDAPMPMEGGWRILQGQRPHADFYTPLGSLVFLLVALGYQVTGFNAAALGFVTVFVFVLTSVWAWLVAWKRTSALLACLLALSAGVMAACPSHLGFDYDAITYAACYNRYGYGLLAIVLIDMLLPAGGASRKADWAGAFSSGLLVGILLFLKINYFGVAALTCLLGLGLIHRSRGRVIAAAAGFAAVVLAMGFYLRFDFTAMIGDLSMAARARGGAITPGSILGIIGGSADGLYLLAALWLLLVGLPCGQANPRACNARIGLGLLAVFLFGALLVATNAVAAKAEVPLYGIAALLALDYGRRRMADAGATGHATAARGAAMAGFYGLVLIALFLAGSHAAKSAAGIVYAIDGHYRIKPQLPGDWRFTAEPLANLCVVRGSGTYEFQASYPRIVNDGLGLLRAHAKPDSRVATLDFVNPFPMALRLPSPRGTALWWHDRINFTERAHPSAERAFGDVTMVMVPKLPENPVTMNLLRSIYGDYLRDQFAPLGESAYWNLFERKPPRQ